jgi:hypothetical protein
MVAPADAVACTVAFPLPHTLPGVVVATVGNGFTVTVVPELTAVVAVAQAAFEVS